MLEATAKQIFAPATYYLPIHDPKSERIDLSQSEEEKHQAIKNYIATKNPPFFKTGEDAKIYLAEDHPLGQDKEALIIEIRLEKGHPYKITADEKIPHAFTMSCFINDNNCKLKITKISQEDMYDTIRDYSSGSSAPNTPLGHSRSSTLDKDDSAPHHLKTLQKVQQKLSANAEAETEEMQDTLPEISHAGNTRRWLLRDKTLRKLILSLGIRLDKVSEENRSAVLSGFKDFILHGVTVPQYGKFYQWYALIVSTLLDTRNTLMSAWAATEISLVAIDFIKNFLGKNDVRELEKSLEEILLGDNSGKNFSDHFGMEKDSVLYIVLPLALFAFMNTAGLARTLWRKNWLSAPTEIDHYIYHDNSEDSVRSERNLVTLTRDAVFSDEKNDEEALLSAKGNELTSTKNSHKKLFNLLWNRELSDDDRMAIFEQIKNLRSKKNRFLTRWQALFTLAHIADAFAPRNQSLAALENSNDFYREAIETLQHAGDKNLLRAPFEKLAARYLLWSLGMPEKNLPMLAALAVIAITSAMLAVAKLYAEYRLIKASLESAVQAIDRITPDKKSDKKPEKHWQELKEFQKDYKAAKKQIIQEKTGEISAWADKKEEASQQLYLKNMRGISFFEAKPITAGETSRAAAMFTSSSVFVLLPAALIALGLVYLLAKIAGFFNGKDNDDVANRATPARYSK